jgi:LacI family transcriptional regulator
MKDVAEKANVSVATVSRVINNETSVSSQHRKAVESAIEELHYELKTTNAQKMGLICRIGLVLPDITNPFFPLLIKGITNISKIYGAEIVLCNSNMDIDIEKYHFEKLLDTGVDGIIYIPFDESVNPVVRKLIKDKFPVVFLDREFDIEITCSVTSNNKEGAYQATSYLLNLGHRDILFISGPRHFSTSITRRAGYIQGLDEFSIDCREDLVIYGDTSQESAYEETIKYISENKGSFTAIFASNDLMAYGAWKALEEKNYSIPVDVSIVGYDDIPFSSFISLTTIAQPSYEIGRNATLLLCDLVNKRREPPQRIVLRDSLIIRKSSRKI